VILVTGATGHVGYRVARRLADAEAPAAAMVRTQVQADGLPPAVAHLVGALDSPPPAEVLRGFDEVFLVSPSREEQVELEVMFVDALVAAGHEPHVVKIACDGFQDPDCDVRFMRNHRQVAQHLEASGLPTTYVAPNLYMENLLRAADTLREVAELRAPAGDGRVGFVATSDVAAVAAHALTAGEQPDRTYVVTGPESLGYADVADRMSSVFAWQVDYVDVPPQQAQEAILARGLPRWQTEGLTELSEWIRGGGCDSVTDDVREATGRDPRPLQDWLSELRGAFIGRPSELPPPQF
jgi:NAD(P)H dehydrogenase (quinone)